MSEIKVNLGNVTNSGSKKLNVKAFDSRNNTTTASKDIMIYDYYKPIINSIVERLNKFENETMLKIDGQFSRLIINSEEKNTLKSLKYRYREVSDNMFNFMDNTIYNRYGLTSTVSNNILSCKGVPQVSYVHITNDIDITNQLTNFQKYTISQSIASDKLSVEVRMTNKRDGSYSYCNCRSATSNTNNFVADKSKYSKYEIYVITSDDLTTPIDLSMSYWLESGNSSWSDFIDISYTIDQKNSKYSCNDIILNLDNTKSYMFEVVATDNFLSVTNSNMVDIGKSIFFISSNTRKLYYNNMEMLEYDVIDEW